MKKWYIVQICAVVLLLGICIFKNIQKNSLYDQNANERWGEKQAQISIMYPLDKNPADRFHFMELSHRIEDELEKSAVAEDIVIDGETGLGFPWSLCINGKITVSSDKADVELGAIGVEQDFFVFHPVQLVGGSYIEADNLMSDGIVIDDDAAWKLFGSDDVVGMSVTVGGVPHYIKGVVKKDDSRFALAAGRDKSMCYVSFDTLEAYGFESGSYTYELILPNPVNGFAMNQVRNTLGQSAEELIVIENSIRFDNSQIRKLLVDFGIRSMNSSGVIFPYFENTARAWEDVFALLLLIEYMLLLVVFTILAIHIYILYKAGKIRKPHIIKFIYGKILLVVKGRKKEKKL